LPRLSRGNIEHFRDARTKQGVSAATVKLDLKLVRSVGAVFGIEKRRPGIRRLNLDPLLIGLQSPHCRKVGVSLVAFARAKVSQAATLICKAPFRRKADALIVVANGSFEVPLVAIGVSPARWLKFDGVAGVHEVGYLNTDELIFQVPPT